MNNIIQKDKQTGAKITALKTANQRDQKLLKTRINKKYHRNV